MATDFSSGLSSVLAGGADTIVARATAGGRGALAVIRVSGPGAREVAGAVCPALDFARVQPALEPIRTIGLLADTIAADFEPPVSVRLTGTVAMEHEELRSVVRGASAAGIAALVMVVVVLLWALRSAVRT